MEYLYYLLAIVAVLGVCLVLFRVPRDPATEGRAEQRARADAAVKDEAGPSPALQRDLKNVPTPWGWPGSDMRSALSPARPHNGSAGSDSAAGLQSWIDRLVAEKRTVDDSEYLLRKDASLRALLEDRFGRSVRPGEIPYRKVRPPMLRDPSRPYDQQDNFPSGRKDRISSGLERQPRGTGAADKKAGVSGAARIRDIKTPWGW